MSSQHHCSHCGYSSAIDNDGTSHHHDRRPAAVTEPYPSATAIYKYGAGHHHDRRPVAVTDPRPSATNTWPGHHHDRRPAAVTEPYPSAAAIDNDGTGCHHHHDCRPAAVTEPHPAAANTWAGRQHDRRPAPVTESYPSATAADNDGADHHHDRRPTAVNELHAAAANTRAGHHHDRTTANCPMAESCPIHHEHPPYNKLTPATDETVTADVSASVNYYDEADAGEDTNDDGEYPIYNLVPIILIVLFFLVYPSLYFSSNRRKQKNTFNLQSSNCACTAKYIRCFK
ncbi:uncharacterized protein LOC132932352 isoform X2 [Rhopalosiphum padi]|nr:uncharacterized protein LOC132932352 isoform X2 [Rhopalosiphum padi]